MGSSRPGVHVSSLIGSIEEQLRMRSSEPFPDGYLFAIAGIAWEGWVRSRLGEEEQGYIWQLEAETDGITGTLDALDVRDPENLEVIECKLNWMSPNKDMSSVWKYQCQIKAYCYMVGATTARMYIYHVQFPPVIRVLRFGFSERELDDNWTMLVNAARAKEMADTNGNN